MARDMKQVIENTRNQPKPLKRWTRRQHDAKGVSNFHLDRDDQIVRTNSGHPRCNYCFIASHPRMNCKFRKHDLRNNVDRAVHPQKGLLSYKDFKKQFTPGIPATALEQLPTTTMEHLPNELLEKICEYLPFGDRCKFGASNNRIRFILAADKCWHKISLPNQLLKYEIINKLVNTGTHSLNIPWGSIDGKWPEMNHLDQNLSTYSSQLRHLNISGFNESTRI